MDETRDVADKILGLLKESGVEFEHYVHKPTPTSQDAADVRGLDIASGVKALILEGKTTGKHYLFCLPGNKKLDFQKIRGLVGEKVQFADPNEIKEKYKLKIGGVPPFGEIIGIQTYFDNSISMMGKVAFNCGLTTESIIMKRRDFELLSDGDIREFTYSDR